MTRSCKGSIKTQSVYHLPINHKDYNFREAQEIKKYFPFRFCGIFSDLHCSHRHSEPLPQYGSFISRISPEYLHTTENIFILWNWTKLWKLDSPTFFHNISKILPYYIKEFFLVSYLAKETKEPLNNS